MKYFSLIVLFIVVSCGKKEDVLLPKSNTTIVSNVEDHSPIYMFFRTKEKDTLAEVNRKNEIISTNWIFNIDKRLPLRLVIPEVMKLQEKKRAEKAHKNEKAENYYSYADTIGKNLAFIPFSKVFYAIGKPLSDYPSIYFNKNGVVVNNVLVLKKQLQDYLSKMFVDNDLKIILCFDKNSSYGSYIQNKIFIRNLVFTKKGISFDENQEFFY